MEKSCIVCDDTFTPKRYDGTRCETCIGKRPKRFSCIECERSVYHKDSRCKECADIARRGEGNPNYKGRSATTQGYVILTLSDGERHPNAQATGRILEHIKVMSDYLGRPLEKGEEVHHRNGNRSDNRIENLELWTRSHPTGVRVVDMYEWATNYIEKYRDEVRRLT